MRNSNLIGRRLSVCVAAMLLEAYCKAQQVPSAAMRGAFEQTHLRKEKRR
jgi:hypothetical protein